MNLKEHGVEWKSEDNVTLWIHPSSGFTKSLLAQHAANVILPYADTDSNTVVNIRSAFIIAEGYVLDYEGDNAHPLIAYFQARSMFDSVSNIENFLLLDYEMIALLIEAFNNTRLAEDDTDTDEPEQKKTPELEKSGLSGQKKEPKPKPKVQAVSSGK